MLKKRIAQTVVNLQPLLRHAPRLIILSLILLVTLTLDALAYGFTHTCVTCTSYFEFIASPSAVSGPILSSIKILMNSRQTPGH